MDEQKEVTTELDKTTLAALSYVLFFITGLFFYVLYKDEYVRYHARQSVMVFGSLFIIFFVFGALGLSGITQLLSILIFILWLVLIYKAWLGERWEVPVIGGMVEQLRAKLVK